MCTGARVRPSLLPALQVIRGPGRCHQLGTPTEPRGTPHPALRFSKVVSTAGIPAPLLLSRPHSTVPRRIHLHKCPHSLLPAQNLEDPSSF